MINKNNRYLAIVLILFVFVVIISTWNKDTSGSEIKPVYKLYDGCKWVKQIFPLNKISFYKQDCKKVFSDWNISFKEEHGKIYLNKNLEIEILSRNLNDEPIKIIERDWFSKFTEEQKNNCEIKSPEIKLPRGIDIIDGLYKTPHKTRYQIQVKEEVAEKFDDISDFDGMCEKKVHYVGGGYYYDQPFFEFDDRYLDRYIVVHSPVFLMEGPAIYDLNTIKFED